MPLHQLALPLPPSYSYNEHENFSFFTSRSEYDNENSNNEVSSLYSEQKLVEYLDDLCAFVKRTRLIQNHPEDYFEYEEQLLRYHCNEPKLSKQNQQELEEEQQEESKITHRMCDHDQVELELKSDHFDFTGVTVGDLKYTMRLCNAFGPLITNNTFSNMQLLIRDGPPLPEPSETTSSSLSMSCEMAKGNKTLSESHETVNQYTELREFFEETKRLQLHRTPVDARHVASLTLTPMWSSSQHVLEEDSTQKEEEEEEHSSKCSTVEEGDVHKEKIMSLVLNRGMSVKKRHEVQIMESAIANLVHCINKNSSDIIYNVNKVNTMINIGEGKGYVSRAVALCDALQVIGLDCNPNHREGAVQRIEQLLEDSLATRHYTMSNVNNNPNGCTKSSSFSKILNLLYEPRGKMYSIACSVDGNVNWHELLSPCVPIYKDKTMSPTESSINSNNIDSKSKYSINDNNIYNKESTITAKEINDREDEDIVEEWLRKKQFDETSASLKKVTDICVVNSKSNSVMTLESAHVIRGTRVIIAAIRNNDKLTEKGHYSSNYVHNEEMKRTQFALCNDDDDSQGYYTITAIGYDEASHRHRVVYDHIPGIHYISLYKPKELNELL